MQDNILRDLLANGFVIFPPLGTGKFILKKIAAPSNTTVMGEREFDSFDAAVAEAKAILDARNGPKLFEFTAVVRYNRGLGIEYKTLPNIQAISLDEAQRLAKNVAEQWLAQPKPKSKAEIREIKVRPKF